MSLDHEAIRRLLCDLGDHLRDAAIEGRRRTSPAELSTVEGETAADTLYGIDRFGDDALLGWFERAWPADEPVEVVSEGLDEPVGVGSGDPRWTAIVDVLDGTRGLMFDKRSAWALAAVAPRGDERPRLSDLVAGAMTEVPTTKQWAADQLSAVRGSRRVVAERVDVLRGGRSPLAVQPSPVTDLRHGFASFARFLPAGKGLTAAIEEELWRVLHPDSRIDDLPIFEDQYLASGGQVHELLTGRDRVLGDLRPLVLAHLGLDLGLCSHPYDVCTAFLLEEAGGAIAHPLGGPVDVPLDTTSPVAWVGVANRALADRVLPALATILERMLR